MVNLPSFWWLCISPCTVGMGDGECVSGKSVSGGGGEGVSGEDATGGESVRGVSGEGCEW